MISLAAVATAVIFWRQAQENTELEQKQLDQLKGERLLGGSQGPEGEVRCPGCRREVRGSGPADPGLKLDLKAEEVDVRRQCATILVQEGEKLAAAGKRQEAAAKFQGALDLDPPPDTPVYVRIPAGEFTMGSGDADTDAYDDEKPQHTVPVGEFWIMRTEVTNAQYLRCVEAGKCDPTR